jgi:phosphoglycolate phosphatase-like HAD superfamily hydrolase
MPSPVVHLVFFDIDGTLVHTAGAGRRAFAHALTRVFGWDDPIEYINFSGATDLRVMEQITAENGRRATPAELARFFAVLPEELALTLAHAQPVLFPGVRELLNRLAGDDRFLAGLVTGNVEACAHLKLAHCNLDGHFFLGAFGHEHADRNEIARLALHRARTHLAPHRRPGRCFLIGDTPADVAAAHAIDATAIAVATGAFSAAQLEEAGADHVLDDLADTDAVMNLLQ